MTNSFLHFGHVLRATKIFSIGEASRSFVWQCGHLISRSFIPKYERSFPFLSVVLCCVFGMRLLDAVFLSRRAVAIAPNNTSRPHCVLPYTSRVTKTKTMMHLYEVSYSSEKGQGKLRVVASHSVWATTEASSRKYGKHRTFP